MYVCPGARLPLGKRGSEILYLQLTVLTQFWVPKGFLLLSWALGSSHHDPSTQNRYSYLPGGRTAEAFHVPFLSFLMGRASTRHSLKSPVTITFSAWGAKYSNFTCLAPALDGMDDFLNIGHLLSQILVQPSLHLFYNTFFQCQDASPLMVQAEWDPFRSKRARLSSGSLLSTHRQDWKDKSSAQNPADTRREQRGVMSQSPCPGRTIYAFT